MGLVEQLLQLFFLKSKNNTKTQKKKSYVSEKNTEFLEISREGFSGNVSKGPSEGFER